MWVLKWFNRDNKRRRESYRDVFCGGRGPEVLADMAQRYCVSRPLCNAETADREAWINEGKREVVLEILHIINMKPDELPKEY